MSMEFYQSDINNSDTGSGVQYIVQKTLNFKMTSAMKLPILSLINSRLEVFLAVENILVMVTALVGNALMCVSVVRLLRKQLPSNLFILSLVSPKLIDLQTMVLVQFF